MLNFNDSERHDKEKEFFPIEGTGAKKPLSEKKADESIKAENLDLCDTIELININLDYRRDIIESLGYYLTENDKMYALEEISEEERDTNRNYINLAIDMLW